MIVQRIYTVFDVYEKIEQLKKGETIKVKFDELSSKIYKYIDQTYFINITDNKYLFKYDIQNKTYICINNKKLTVTI